MKTQLRILAKEASEKAYSPYSKVKVGSALVTTKGDYYSGCNVENASYGGTVCAERVAIFKAVSENEIKIKKLYVYSKDGWPPCGFCRQVIAEFAEKDLTIIIGDQEGNEKEIQFDKLMPYQFSASHLNK